MSEQVCPCCGIKQPTSNGNIVRGGVWVCLHCYVRGKRLIRADGRK